jgi:hypothetical protein
VSSAAPGSSKNCRRRGRLRLLQRVAQDKRIEWPLSTVTTEPLM